MERFPNTRHYDAIAGEPAFASALKRCGFEPARSFSAAANDGLAAHNRHWMIAVDPRQKHLVSVQIAAWRLDELRLEVRPYHDWWDDPPGPRPRKALHLRARLLLDIRRRIMTDRALRPLGPHTRFLSDPVLHPKAVCAVKFRRRLGLRPTAADSAAFFAEVLDAVAPVVEAALIHARFPTCP